MSVVKRLVTLAAHRQVSKLDDLYQRHAGQECYLFGDGISLKWMDLRNFADRPSILGGMLIYHREASALRIPYAVISEPYWFWPVFPYNGKLIRNAMHEEFRRSIRQNPETLFVINISNYPVARFANGLYVSRWYVPPFETQNPFRDRTDSHRSTLSLQLTLAIFLGFRKAYLIGHDYTHFPSKMRHFYEKGTGSPHESRYFSRDFIDYARQHIDLVTVTLDAGSETMDHVTYKALTGREPRFRENTELVPRPKLENLATWRGYSIF